MSEAHKGEKAQAWKGGVTPINQIIRGSLEMRLWREAVFERDNWTCQHCQSRSAQGAKVILNADHIKRFAEYPELRFDVSNGRTLCEPCHKKTDTWGNKKVIKDN